MKKMAFYAAAAAIVMTGTASMTSMAAVKGYVISGGGANGNFHVESLHGLETLRGMTGDLLSAFNCDIPSLEIIFPNEMQGGNQGESGTVKPEETPDNSGSGSVSQGNQSYVQQVINLVNQERAKAGLSPLTESAAVSQAAVVRAQEISKSFSHTRPDGSSFSTALDQSGASYHTSGENIAYGQETPEMVMNSWMNSQGHRANILNSKYTKIGVGYYVDGNGRSHWAQLFTN